MDPIIAFFVWFGVVLIAGLAVVFIRSSLRKTRVSTIVLFTVALFSISGGLAGYLRASIKETIDFKNSIASTEEKVIEKLKVIREAQKVYLEQHGKYTSDWDSLINFIKNGIVPVTVRVEKVIPLSYGADSIYVRIDTIDQIPAKERIFKKTHLVNAASDGTFMGFFVKEGDEVIRGAKSYRLKREGSEKVEEFIFLENGKVSKLADVQPGDEVNRGQTLITLWEYQFDPNLDIETLNIVPGTNKEFEIYTNRLNRNGVWVNVIHVMDPEPVNPERSEQNEAKNRQPLQFGSKSDVNTSGNWE